MAGDSTPHCEMLFMSPALPLHPKNLGKVQEAQAVSISKPWLGRRLVPKHLLILQLRSGSYLHL